jgi:hypothetical protein
MMKIEQTKGRERKGKEKGKKGRRKELLLIPIDEYDHENSREMVAFALRSTKQQSEQGRRENEQEAELQLN